MSGERLWNVEEVATFLAVSPTTVRAWQQARRLPFVKIGGTIRFVPEEVREWLAQGDGKARCLRRRRSGAGLLASSRRG